MKKNTKKKDNSKSKFVSLLIVIIVFAIAFIILIKEQKGNYYFNAKKGNFDIKTEYGKTIVAKDTYASYPKYYVVYVSDNNYSIYVFNYYETESQYELEFNRLLDTIVDYNVNNKMIRYLHSKGYGTYDEIYNNLSALLENEKIEIY